MKNRTGWLFVVVFVFACWAQAQFTFSVSNQRVCPSSNTVAGTFLLSNSTANPQTINAGTTMTFSFDAPISGLPTYTGPGSPNITGSGSVVNVTFNQATAVPPGASMSFANTRLSLTGQADGAAIMVDGNGFLATGGISSGRVATVAPIVATPTSLSFSSPPNVSANTQVVALSGSGAQFPYTVNVATTSGGNWLSVDPSLGPGTQLTVTVNTGGLSEQSYAGSLAIADSVGNACQSIPVTLAVAAQRLAISVTALTFNAPAGATFVPVQQFTIAANTGTLNWTASSSTITGGNWLLTTSTTGATPATVNAQVSVIGLAKGSYQGAITIAAIGASNSPQTITVTLNVADPPVIQLSASTLTFSAPQGGANPATQSFAVNNTGGGTLEFQSSVSTVSGGSWLSVSPSTGAAPAVLTVNANLTPGGTPLAAGSYTGAVQINATGATNTPQSVRITLNVTAPSNSTIALGPSSLRFVTNPGDASPAAQTFQITNSGTTGSTLGWSASASTTDGLSWLTVFPTTGVAPSTLQVSVNSSRLAAGTYTGSVKIDATAGSNANNSPQTLPVTLVIGAPLVSDGGIVNGASFAANTAVGPGGILSLFGTKLAASAASATSLPLPRILNGVKVTVNGSVDAPLFYVSPTQINFQMPVEVTGTSASLVVTNGGIQGPAATVGLTPEAPGFFTVATSGSGQAAALNADSTPNSGTNPAAGGTTVSLFASGLGATNPPYLTGQTGATAEPLNRTVQTPTVTVNGVASTVGFSGLAPGFVGLYQVNVTVPPGTPAGASVPVTLTINGRVSNTVTIAVR